MDTTTEIMIVVLCGERKTNFSHESVRRVIDLLPQFGSNFISINDFRKVCLTLNNTLFEIVFNNSESFAFRLIQMLNYIFKNNDTYNRNSFTV